jgi:hypothetical protein
MIARIIVRRHDRRTAFARNRLGDLGAIHRRALVRTISAP